VVEAERGAHGRARLGRPGQDPDALVLVGELELALRADHALALEAADLRLLELEPAGELDARERHGYVLPARDVARAAHDLDELPLAARADVDLAERQLVGVRVAAVLDHVADDDVREPGREGLDALDLGRVDRQVVRDLLRREAGEIDVTSEPAVGDVHRASSLTRTAPGSAGRRPSGGGCRRC